MSKVCELTRYSGRELQKSLPVKRKRKGLNIKMVDGTTLSMPDTPDVCELLNEQGFEGMKEAMTLLINEAK